MTETSDLVAVADKLRDNRAEQRARVEARRTVHMAAVAACDRELAAIDAQYIAALRIVAQNFADAVTEEVRSAAR